MSVTLVCLSKTNKDKSTEIFSPLLPKPTFICEHAMPIGKKGQQKVPFNEDDIALPL